MPLPVPAPGLVLGYAYLWREEAARGLREGRKDRPVVVVIATRDVDGDTVVYVAPVTHSDPGDDLAVAIPAAVKRRLSMDDTASWVVTSEVNRFVWPGHDLRPVSRRKPGTFAWGYLPTEVFAKVKQGVRSHAARQALSSTDRD